MKLLRKIIFWLHLIAGLIAGLSIGIMCFTGTALAFEKEIVAWSQRDLRTVDAPTNDTPRLTLAQLQAKLREAQPEARPASIVIQNDPRAAVAFPAGGRGGAGGFYANPYTGEIRQAPTSSGASAFMQTMTSWHRYLNFTGDVSRPRGKWINGVCNLAFAFLAVSGLYLWWPRKWRTKGLKRSVVLVRGAAGKARDWNWHNVIGLYSAPVLIVLTLTAVPISFQWGGRVINSLTGTPQPAAGTPAGPGAAATALPPITITPPAADARPLTQDELVALVQKEIPSWKTITIGGAGARGGPGGGAPGGGGGSSRGGPAGRGDRGTNGSEGVPPRTLADASTVSPTIASTNAAPAIAPAATFTVRASDSWPRTANTTLTLNPYTGELLRRTGYADQAPAQRVRSWTRFLHTGEALGFWGQLVAGLACLGGCVLVYTGFALSWRRFFMKRPAETPIPTKA